MTRTFHVETFGCPTNKSDSEIIVGLLEREGLRLVDGPRSADLIIVNTCAVKAPTERRVLRRIGELGGLGKRLIIAGCLPRLSLGRIRAAAPDFAAALDPRSVDRIADVVWRVLDGERGLVVFSDQTPRKPRLPRRVLDRVRGIVQIAEGCAGSCTYCCVRFARGPICSFDRDDVLDEARSMLAAGRKELWITSQDTAAYGLDTGPTLPRLLSDLCDLPYRFFVRVGMMNPRNALPILDDLIDAYRHPKVYKFLHLPVQSGDDDVLSAMGRGYTADDFVSIVERFREAFPRLTLATDVIVGFPGETEEQFRRSMALLERVRPDIVNVSRFGIRPGAPAAAFPRRVDEREKKRRSREASKLVRRIGLEVNSGWVGWSGMALVSEVGLKGGWVARNYAYKPVVIRGGVGLLGRFINVKVTEARPTYLLGEPCPR